MATLTADSFPDRAIGGGWRERFVEMVVATQAETIVLR
jgi:hypothetical protein